MPDIIVHGASSFLGRHFVKKLISKKIPVLILARETSQISFFENQPFVKVIRYKKTISEINAPLYQLSAPMFFEFSWQGVFGSDRNNPEQISVNVPLITSSVNTANMLKAKHWIGVGSQAEYGNLNKRISENDICNPTTLYGKAKLMCSQNSADLCRKFGIEHSWLRLFSVYGPDDNNEWLIQYLIKEMLEDKEINVTKGEQKWDYLFVDDISEMFLMLMNTKGVGVANLGSGKVIQVRWIIEKIKELTKSNSKINFGAISYRPDQVMLMEADITRLSSHLGWVPLTGIDEGLRKTIDFLKFQKPQLPV